MKTKTILLLLSLILFSNFAFPQSVEIEYFGQDLPGDSAQIFAPGIISLTNRYEQAFSYSPTGKKCYISLTDEYWYYMDILEQTKTNNEWSEGTRPEFLSSLEEGQTPVFYPDEQNVFITSGYYAEDESWISQIYKSSLVDGNWTTPNLIEGSGDSTEISNYHLCFTNDGTMYLSAIRPNGIGYIDIFEVRQEGGKYSSFEPIESINTTVSDCSPVVSPDGSYMIFESTREGSFGGYDLYVTFKDDDDSWSEPINLGENVNTKDHEMAAYITPDSKNIIFSRRDTSEIAAYSDIYWVSADIIGSLKGNLTKKYFRHLQFNHISPYFDYKGIYEISEEEAKETNHYCFCYDEGEKLLSITEHGNCYGGNIHPMALIGAKKVEISYIGNTITQSYLNAKGKPCANYKGIYMEKIVLDEEGRKKSLKYYDYQGTAMESEWGISEYIWDYTDSLIIEKRKNLDNEFVDVSPYFPFRFSALKTDPENNTITHYNVDENNQVVDNALGVAYYLDKFDLEGSQSLWSYYNAANQSVAPVDYTHAINTYNEKGYLIRADFYENSVLFAYQLFDYDIKGDIILSEYYLFDNLETTSTNTEILDFVIENQVKPAVVDNQSYTIDVFLSENTYLGYLVPEISTGENCILQPSSGVPVDFSNKRLVYNVFAENTTAKQEWTVNINIEKTTTIKSLDITKVNVYPNPNTGQFKILLNQEKSSDLLLRITNTNGKIVYTQKYTNTPNHFKTQINLPDVESGIYFIQMSNGNETMNRKIIVY